MILVSKQAYRRMEQTSELRSKSAHLWPTDTQHRDEGYTMEKELSLQQMVLWETISMPRRMLLDTYFTPYRLGHLY